VVSLPEKVDTRGWSIMLSRHPQVVPRAEKAVRFMMH
jgi:hypothetical protein